MSGACEACQHWTRDAPEIPGKPLDSYPWGKCWEPTQNTSSEPFNWAHRHQHETCRFWAQKGQPPAAPAPLWDTMKAAWKARQA